MNAGGQRERVLVVEDNRSTAELIDRYLAASGFEPTTVHDGRGALIAARKERPDLVVLDLMIPELDGFAVCRALRDEASVPIIMLTARAGEEDRVRGLELGADDYVVKPFSPRELVARIRAVLRRSGGKRASPRLVVGDLELDREARHARLDGRPLDLTRKEHDLLVVLADSPGRAFRREELLERVWPNEDATPRAVDMHVVNLRRKLEEDPSEPRRLRTVYGIGYALHPVGRTAAPDA